MREVVDACKTGQDEEWVQNGNTRMKYGTIKAVWWIAIPVLIIGFVAWQWSGVAQGKRALEAGIAKLEQDLRMIADARLKIPDITERIVREKAVMEGLDECLPREPMIENFIVTLSDRLKRAGIEVSTYTSISQKREFYDEHHLEIFIKQEPLEL